MASPMSKLPSSGRIEALDSIRGLAALAVLLGHILNTVLWPGNANWASYPFINIFFDGRPAVTMFFVLSGFVLSRPYLPSLNQPARTIHVPTFYLRRFTRIWIPWFFVFCLSALAQAYF